MKKYVKPELFYERFELSQHIADCLWELNSADTSSCAAENENSIPGAPTIFNILGVCDMTPDAVEDYCYQPGTGGNLFKS